MIALYWPLVFLVTLPLYIFIIITLPFSQNTATFFLLFLIAYWSRLPGVGTPHPLFALLSLDLMDIFAIIITIKMGIFPGILFALGVSVISRASGNWPDWGAIASDSIALTLTIIITPIIYAVSSQSIFMTIVLFTLIRTLIWIPLDVFLWPNPIAKYIIEWIPGTAILFAINIFYANVLGTFLQNLVDKTSFPWLAFLLTTIVIIIFTLAFKKKSTSLPIKSITKSLKRIFKKQKHKKKYN